MIVWIRIALIASSGAVGATLFWWVFERFGNVFGLPNAPELSLWIIGLTGGILAGCGEAWRICVERRRTRMNREVARRLDCEFVNYVSLTDIRSWPAVSLFRKDSPSGSHRMTGTYNGHRIDVLDFKYIVTSTSTGDSSSSTSTYSQTVYRFPEAAQGWHRFLLKPRHRLVGLLSSMFGQMELELSPPNVADHDLTSAFARFRKHYQITVPDGPESPGDFQRLFHPFVVCWLSLRPGWSIESKDGDVVAWRSNATVVGAERLRKLDELGELLSLIAASDMALERMEPARVEVRAHDRARGLSGFMGLWTGMMLGVAAGGMLGSRLLAEVFALMPDKAPKFPVVVVMFFGCTIAFAALGGFLGLRLGRRSEWGRRLAKRIDPCPTDDSSSGRTEEA